MIDVLLARDVVAKLGERLALLENEPHFFRGPKLREKFLSVMLDQLHRRLVQDQSLAREGEEKRAAGLPLFVAALLGLFRVDVDESDRRFRAIELRIARGDEDDLSIFREQLDRRLVPERSEGSSQFLFPDRVQRAVQGKEAGVAGEKRAVKRQRLFGRGFVGNRGSGGIFQIGS